MRRLQNAERRRFIDRKRRPNPALDGPIRCDGCTLNQDSEAESTDRLQTSLKRPLNSTPPRPRHCPPTELPADRRLPTDFPLAAPLPQGSLSSNDAQVPDNQRIASDNYPLLIRVALSSDCICRGPAPLFRSELDDGTLREVDTRRSVIWQSACLMSP